jgi:hypothetical protein
MATMAPDIAERTGADDRPVPGARAKFIPAIAEGGRPEIAVARTALDGATATKAANGEPMATAPMMPIKPSEATVRIRHTPG